MRPTLIAIPGASRLRIRRFPHAVTITCPTCDMTARYVYDGEPARVTTFLHLANCALGAEIQRAIDKAQQAGFPIQGHQ